jgi:hypothetical protein
MEDAREKTARHRLLLGITNVGFWVVASLVGLWWFTSAPGLAVGLTELFCGLLCTVVAQSVFDWLGGAVLIPGAGAGANGFPTRWARAAIAHTTLLASTGVLLFWSHRWFGSFCPGVAVCSVVLALGRPRVLQLLTGVRLKASSLGDTFCWSAGSKDPAFTGGVCGYGRSAVIVIPASWQRDLTGAQADTVRVRRLSEIQYGLPARAFLAATVWNLAGCWTGTFLFGLHSIPTERALLMHGLWMTVWGFFGLLLLPSASRGAVFFLDRAAASKGCDVADWIRKFPEITGEDGSSKTLVQRVFYPIPSADERLRGLDQVPAQPVFGNVARTNLYLSLATLTILGRCVHCNVGRPELWVFAPSD